MNDTLLNGTIQKHFELHEVRPGADVRNFVLVLRYVDDHVIDERRHAWSVSRATVEQSPGELGDCELRERARFEQEIEDWLSRSKMRLVMGDALPVLAPIEDGA